MATSPKSILATAHPHDPNIPKKKVSFSQNPPQVFRFEKEQKKKKRKNKKNKFVGITRLPQSSHPQSGINMQIVEREPPSKIAKAEIVETQQQTQPPSTPSVEPTLTPIVQPQQQQQQPQKKVSLYQQMKKK